MKRIKLFTDIREDEKYLNNILLTIVSTGSMLLLIYGIINILTHQYLVGILEILVSLYLIVINIIFLIYKKDNRLPLISFDIIMIVLTAYLYINGGFNNTGIFWCLAIPPIFITTQGKRDGLLWIGVEVLVMFTAFVLSLFNVITIAYDHFTSFSAFVVFLVETYALLTYEVIRSRYKKKINKLEELLPICANCKKIRDENGNWDPIDNYLNTHAEMDFTHGYCPDCLKKLYPEYYK